MQVSSAMCCCLICLIAGAALKRGTKIAMRTEKEMRQGEQKREGAKGRRTIKME